jgi:hypothetical protein
MPIYDCGDPDCTECKHAFRTPKEKPRMAGKVAESIWNGRSLVVPLADVQHIEKQPAGALTVVTKHTRWETDGDYWANAICVDAADAASFMAAWCRYRSELEADALANLEPA